MTIQQVLNEIRNATYGRDVREALHDGIETCYNERLPGGSYTASATINTFYSGIGLFPSGTTNRPFNSSFMLIAAGDENNCLQIAYDQTNSNAPKKRSKTNGTWDSWSNL